MSQDVTTLGRHELECFSRNATLKHFYLRFLYWLEIIFSNINYFDKNKTVTNEKGDGGSDTLSALSTVW